MGLVPKVRPLSRARIHRIAEEILNEVDPLHLEQPGELDVIEFFEILRDEFGLRNEVVDLPVGIEGRTWPDGRVQVSETTYRGAVQGNPRSRFTIMHEAAHGILHRRQLQTFLEDLEQTGEFALHRRRDIRAFEDPEWQANEFAAAALMPSEMVKTVFEDGSLFDEYEIVRTFGVSWQAAGIRIQVLEKMGVLKK